jgi:hypothetical protein
VWWANFVRTMYHGNELDQFTSARVGHGYLAYLRTKTGLDAAIPIAIGAGLPLHVAARLRLAHTQDLKVQA